ncbi:MAG: hypothetical protein U9O94_01270 [Nanoarchaeota archaeon]|nr:hypothetical protein [Nanoarchaeota archaeon]
MTNEQVGIYIKLLCIQHQHGGIIKKEIYEGVIDNHQIIKDKFVKTEDGYFNVKMSKVMEERSRKSDNMSINAHKRWAEYKTMQKHSNSIATAMPPKDVNKDKDVNTIKNKVFKQPTNKEVNDYCKERKNDVDPNKWYNFYEAKGWMIGKNSMKDWKAAVRTWEKSKPANKPKTSLEEAFERD